MVTTKTITKIEFQQNRLSVFLEGTYAFGLSVSLLSRFNLREGDTLSDERVAEILAHEERVQIQESAFRYLAGRAHSEFELRTKLLRKTFSEEGIDAVLSDFRARKYIDDSQFAVTYARTRIGRKPVGRRRLHYELHQKGLSRELIDRALQLVYAEVDELELAKNLVDKTKGRYAKLDEKSHRRRLQDLLLRRGFSWDIINEAIHHTKSTRSN